MTLEVIQGIMDNSKNNPGAPPLDNLVMAAEPRLGESRTMTGSDVSTITSASGAHGAGSQSTPSPQGNNAVEDVTRDGGYYDSINASTPESTAVSEEKRSNGKSFAFGSIR